MARLLLAIVYVSVTTLAELEQGIAKLRRKEWALRALFGCLLLVFAALIALGYFLRGPIDGCVYGPPTAEDVPTISPPSLDQEAAPEDGPEPKLTPAATPNVTDPRPPGAGSSWDWGPPP